MWQLKKDYMEGMTDSVDLVPVGAWFGKGKRTGTFGAYLMACFEADDEEFQAITKVQWHSIPAAGSALTGMSQQLSLPSVIDRWEQGFPMSF